MFFDGLFSILHHVEAFFWSYVAFGVVALIGLFLTLKSRFFQVRQLPNIIKTFVEFLKSPANEERGVHPLKAFFASVGGMIGIGNVCGVVTALQIGGPGALFWVWVMGMVGAIVKYSEIYLGLKYRQPNEQGGYDGGPMYFLQKAFKYKWIPMLVATLLCIYGVEIYLFSVVTESVSSNWAINRYLVIAGLMGLVFYCGLGGVKRIGKICVIVMPVFVLIYVGMALFVLGHEIHHLPSVIGLVVKSAFTGHSAVGGFVGSSVMLAISQGVARTAYSSDIGIGFDSIIQSESSTVKPQKQACLAILGVLLDNLVCTVSLLLVLVSGLWTAFPQIPGSKLVQTALSAHFPYMHIFMPSFLVIVGFTPLIAYFVVGLKCARFLHLKYGPRLFLIYAAFSFLFFSFFDQSKALTVMAVAGALLLTVNLFGIYRLRKEVSFEAVEVSDSLEIA